MTLVDDAKQWWRWHSVRALAVLGIVAEAWLNSPTLQAWLPTRWASVAVGVAAAIVFVLRIRKQVAKTAPADTKGH